MIVRPRTGLLKLFFVMRGSVVPRILPQIFGFALYGALVVAAIKALDLNLGDAGVAPFALLGVALSIYLGFRNNAAYDRWWEARKLWGQLVFEIRNLSRAANAMISDRDELRPFLMDALAFCHFLRGELRRVDTREAARPFIGDAVDEIHAATNKPDATIRRMGTRLALLKRAKVLEAMDYRILDERLSAIAALQAGCERIMGTPLPFAYTLLLYRTAWLYCLFLPVGLSGSLGWATPAAVALVAYTFFGLDALGDELEEPFGTDPNDLPLDAMLRMVEAIVLDALGEPVPEPLRPKNFLLR